MSDRHVRALLDAARTLGIEGISILPGRKHHKVMLNGEFLLNLPHGGGSGRPMKVRLSTLRQRVGQRLR